MVNQMLSQCKGFQSAARKQQAEFLKLRYELNIRYGKSGWHNRHQARGLSFKIFCKYSSFKKIEPLLKTKKLKRDTNALTAVGALMTLIDFTLANARRFYSSMGNPLAVKGLKVGQVKTRSNGMLRT